MNKRLTLAESIKAEAQLLMNHEKHTKSQSGDKIINRFMTYSEVAGTLQRIVARWEKGHDIKYEDGKVIRNDSQKES